MTTTLRVCECGEWTYAPVCGCPCRRPAAEPPAAEQPLAPVEADRPTGQFRFTVEPLAVGTASYGRGRRVR